MAFGAQKVRYVKIDKLVTQPLLRAAHGCPTPPHRTLYIISISCAADTNEHVAEVVGARKPGNLCRRARVRGTPRAAKARARRAAEPP